MATAPQTTDGRHAESSTAAEPGEPDEAPARPGRRERKAARREAKRERRAAKRDKTPAAGDAGDAGDVGTAGTESGAGSVTDVVRLTGVRKTYGGRRNPVVALDGVTLGFERGTFTAVMGPSGSGKSTFLHCAAGLDQPTSGSVVLDGEDLTGMNELELTRLRRERIGFVFQAFNLLPALTVLENVTLPLRLAGRRPSRGAVADVIGRVGLGDRLRHRPAELSGGQQQRVAIARALVTRPAVIFGDEPTGALDTRTSLEVLRLLRESVDQYGQTVIIVTHDPVAAAHADRVVFLADGRVAGELHRPTADAVAERMTHLGAWGDPVDPANTAAARRPVGAGSEA